MSNFAIYDVGTILIGNMDDIDNPTVMLMILDNSKNNAKFLILRLNNDNMLDVVGKIISQPIHYAQLFKVYNA